MDLATIIGIILGFALIIGSILLDGSLMAFVNAPGLLIVLGGTVAATLIMARMGKVIGAIGVAMNAFFDRVPDVDALVETIHEMSAKARKEGMLGLESIEIENPFLKRATQLAIDGMPKEFVLDTMARELAEVHARHVSGQQIFKFMCSTAPSMGMIGTLIGLVNMLQALDDPAAIGPAMAVALLTTFYGAVFAFLIFGPIADKLASRDQEEQLVGKIAMAGIESVIQGDNRTVTQTRIDSYLSPRERDKAAEKNES